MILNGRVYTMRKRFCHLIPQCHNKWSGNVRQGIITLGEGASIGGIFLNLYLEKMVYMIYLTGDTHGGMDAEKLFPENFSGEGLTKNDYVIILGDFGFIWKYNPNKAEKRWMKFFETRPWTTLFIDGNHCLSKDTELLTDKGWVNIVNVYENLSNYTIATMNLQTKAIEFENISIKHKTFKDTAVVIESNDTKQIVSFNHNVVVNNEKVKAVDLIGKTIESKSIPILNEYNNVIYSNNSITPYVIDYNDYMYCFTTKNGTLVTRNGYKIAITGNCNFTRLNSYPITQWNGGNVHIINDSVIHLMRGQVFNIEGKTFFTMGGAESYDKQYRTIGLSWWKEEIPSYSEIEEGFRNLNKHNNTVDYVLTHTSPSRFVHQMIDYADATDPTHKMLDAIEETITFKHWFYGHWHLDMQFDDKFTCLYNSIINLNKY